MMPGSPSTIHNVILNPGEFHFGRGNTCVHTLLGSCVAITLWHPQKRVGGMCHYLLSLRGNNRRLSHGHYADDVMQLFMEAIRAESTRPHEYEVKLFGGGTMFDYAGYAGRDANGGGVASVSRNNIKSGVTLLREHGFRIKASDVGGTCHRKIRLELWSGDVWVQRGDTVRECA